MVACATVHPLPAGTLHLFGSAVLAGDYLGCLPGVRLGRWQRNAADGETGKRILYRLPAAADDVQRVSAYFAELGGSALYPVQHGDGFYLAATSRDKPQALTSSLIAGGRHLTYGHRASLMPLCQSFYENVAVQ